MQIINSLDILYYSTSVMVIILSTIGLFLSYVYSRTKYEMLRLEEIKIILDANIDETIPQLLNTVIEDSFNEYMYLNELYKESEDINSEREREILDGVTEYVKNRMSDTVMRKLLMYYHEDAIWDEIGKKIYILISNYVSENNTIEED